MSKAVAEEDPVPCDDSNEKAASTPSEETKKNDPLLALPSNTVREGDYFILVFGDGKQIFGQCLHPKTNQKMAVRINKRAYLTYHLRGLPYGTVLEQGPRRLVPLPTGEGLLPSFPSVPSAPTPPPPGSGAATESASTSDGGDTDKDTTSTNAAPTTATADPGDDLNTSTRDNRHLVDNNTSQALNQDKLRAMREAGTHGATIVQHIIENSSTFQSKTDFSRAKYVARKQLKYQPRCRLVRCTGASICEALFLKDNRRIMNMREDTLGQILSYSNICAGSQVLVWETCMGVVTGSVAQRLGGYGTVLSVYSGQQQNFNEMIARFNLSFAENFSIKWVHSGDVIGNHNDDDDEEDLEKLDREVIEWPCPLQDHTRTYLEGMKSETKIRAFLAKRAGRFARKLTRHSPLETKSILHSRKCDSLILVVRYDPTETLMSTLPYLENSCPFVVYCEYIEPLCKCFLELQKSKLAVNLRLSDTWAREYQVLPGRTHPNMNMSQSGGFILTGMKLDPESGAIDLDDELKKEIRLKMGTRRGGRKGNKRKKAEEGEDNGTARKEQSLASPGENGKRQRVEAEAK